MRQRLDGNQAARREAMEKFDSEAAELRDAVDRQQRMVDDLAAARRRLQDAPQTVAEDLRQATDKHRADLETRLLNALHFLGTNRRYLTGPHAPEHNATARLQAATRERDTIKAKLARQKASPNWHSRTGNVSAADLAAAEKRVSQAEAELAQARDRCAAYEREARELIGKLDALDADNKPAADDDGDA